MNRNRCTIRLLPRVTMGVSQGYSSGYYVVREVARRVPYRKHQGSSFGGVERVTRDLITALQAFMGLPREG